MWIKCSNSFIFISLEKVDNEAIYQNMYNSFFKKSKEKDLDITKH